MIIVNVPQPILKPMFGNRWNLVEDFKINGVTIPKGYITNGANVPRSLWGLLPPNKSDFMSGIIYHDFMCDKEKYKGADDGLELILNSILHLKELEKTDNIEDRLQVKMIMSGVRVYHKAHGYY